MHYVYDPSTWPRTRTRTVVGSAAEAVVVAVGLSRERAAQLAEEERPPELEPEGDPEE